MRRSGGLLGSVSAALRSPTRSLIASDCRGASAVEFSLIAFPFLALLCLILEAGFVFLSQQTLDVAVDRASRLLRTGEFQDGANGSEPGERLRRLMCGSRVVFFRCDDVRLAGGRYRRFARARSQPVPLRASRPSLMACQQRRVGAAYRVRAAHKENPPRRGRV
nr:TadE/TadG family type IV pilus assembly protein [Methylobacterium segetis]